MHILFALTYINAEQIKFTGISSSISHLPIKGSHATRVVIAYNPHYCLPRKTHTILCSLPYRLELNNKMDPVQSYLISLKKWYKRGWRTHPYSQNYHTPGPPALLSGTRTHKYIVIHAGVWTTPICYTARRVSDRRPSQSEWEARVRGWSTPILLTWASPHLIEPDYHKSPHPKWREETAHSAHWWQSRVPVEAVSCPSLYWCSRLSVKLKPPRRVDFCTNRLQKFQVLV